MVRALSNCASWLTVTSTRQMDTGGEVLGLRWSEVDLPRRTTRLADTKTDASLQPLSDAACAVISAQPGNGDVVFASRSGGSIVGYRKMWLRIAKLGGICQPTSRPMCYGTASPVLLPTSAITSRPFATLLGHKTHSIPSRYRAFPRCRVAGSSRCRGECHHELMVSDQAQPWLRDQGEMGQWCGTNSPYYRCFRDT